MQGSLWNRCLAQLETEMPEQQFNTWIRPLQAIEDLGVLRLLAPNRFVVEWVNQNVVQRIVELGSTAAEPDGTRRGAWHLWVYMADWRIEYAGQVVVGSADLPGRIDEVLMQLGPRTFESFTIDPATGDTALQLSDEVRLVVLSSALPDDDSEAWILTQSDGTTLSGGPASRWTLEAAP